MSSCAATTPMEPTEAVSPEIKTASAAAPIAYAAESIIPSVKAIIGFLLLFSKIKLASSNVPSTVPPGESMYKIIFSTDESFMALRMSRSTSCDDVPPDI